MQRDTVLFEGKGDQGTYQVVDCIYSGRPARILYTGNRMSAQSGVARDDSEELIFDYNQRFLELVRNLTVKRLLLIGGGAFTLPLALEKEFPDMYIDVVEPEKELFAIAQEYFNYHPTKRTRIFHEYGRQYLERVSTKYDLIIIDAFTDTIVPSDLQTIEAAQTLRNHVSPCGLVAMNVIAAYHGERSAVMRRIVAGYQKAFAEVAIFPASLSISAWTPQNFVCLGSADPQPLQDYMRYAPQPLPQLTAEDELHD